MGRYLEFLEKLSSADKRAMLNTRAGVVASITDAQVDAILRASAILRDAELYVAADDYSRVSVHSTEDSRRELVKMLVL